MRRKVFFYIKKFILLSKMFNQNVFLFFSLAILLVTLLILLTFHAYFVYRVLQGEIQYWDQQQQQQQELTNRQDDVLLGKNNNISFL